MTESTLQMLATFFAMIGALSAFATVFTHRRGQRLLREGAIYHLAVADPMQQYLQGFVDETMRLLKRGLSEMDAFPADAALSAATDVHQRLVDEFDDRWSTLKWRLLAGIRAWPDEQLRLQVHLALQEVYDAITVELDRRVMTAPSNRHMLPHFRAVLENHAARMLHLVVTHDPVLRNKGRRWWLLFRKKAEPQPLPPIQDLRSPPPAT